MRELLHNIWDLNSNFRSSSKQSGSTFGDGRNEKGEITRVATKEWAAL